MDDSFDDVLINHDDVYLDLGDIKINVNKGVFLPDPKITNSTPLLLRNIKDVKGKSVLDMGCGCGVISICCALKGAKKVVACDIDPKSVKNTLNNIRIFGFSRNIEVINSNLFENIEGKFDLIYGNLPINENLWGIDSKKLMKEFIEKAKGYINSGGKIYFTWFSISDVKPIRDYCFLEGYKVMEESENKFGFKWYLFELS